MSYILTPCGALLFFFFISFGFCWWFIKMTVIRSLESRVSWLEEQIQPQEQPVYRPRPVRSRYIPLEQRQLVHYVED
jgi:hypothetical protein